MSTQLTDLPCSKLFDLPKDTPLIDIRRETEFNTTGIIKGSFKLTFFDEFGNYDLEKWLHDFEQLVTTKDQPFVLICAHANRTRDVGTYLINQLHYTNVYHLKGGIAQWIFEQREVVSP
ncbi:MAG: rhodanese-like domain-containing protein [Candidatus Marinarcus sp.]|uniref:rhodanese-like domain-containing protein n=1 Tax=Candidatus Marinarcus sp. TaxID=3100987 RepID=UPI003AFF714D